MSEELNESTKAAVEAVNAQLIEKGVIDAPQEKESSKESKEEKPVLDKPRVSVRESRIANDKDLSDNETEAEALKKGWTPDGPKSAEEFLRAEPLYDALKSKGKEIKDLRKTIDELKTWVDKSKKSGYDQAVKELNQQKEEAIYLGDVDAVKNVDKQLDEQKQEYGASPVAPSSEVSEFMKRNSDWVNDPSYEAQKIREFAHKRDNEIVHFNLTPKEHLEVIESDIKKQFKERFTSETDEVNRDIPAVEGGGNISQKSSKKRHTFSDLNSEQKKCARAFESRGIMSTEEYVKSLIDMGEL